MPKLQLKSNARPATYAYPPPLEEKKREEREKVATAALSFAARSRRNRGQPASVSTSSGETKMEVVSCIDLCLLSTNHIISE